MMESLSVPLGFDVSVGLDGGYIEHLMSPGGYHICAVGAQPERQAFRDRFIQAVRDAGVDDIVLIDSQDADLERTITRAVNDLRWRQGTRMAPDLPPRLVVVPSDLPEKYRGQVRKLIDEGRFYGVTLLTEFDRVGAPHMTYSSANSQTIVYVGANSAKEAALHLGWATPSIPADAHLAQRDSTRILPVVLL